jgi:hypothetical protein
VDRRRHADLRERARQAHLAVTAEKRSFFEQRAGQLLHVERVALGAPDDRAFELRGQAAAGHGACNRRRLGVRQPAKRQPRERGLHVPRRLKIRAVGGEDHHPVVPQTRHRHLDHLARRLVHPVKVLDDEQRRRARGRGAGQPADGLDRATLYLLAAFVVQAAARDAEQAPEVGDPSVERALDRADPGDDLLAGVCGRLARRDLEELPKHARDRGVWDRLAERGASRLEEEMLLTGDPLAELVDQTGLAAAGVSDNRHYLWESLRDALEARDDLGYFGVAASQGRQPPRLGDCHRRIDAACPGNLKGGHGLALALDLERSAGTHIEEAPHQSLGGFADEHRAWFRQRLKPRGEVRGVADRRVVGLEIAADRADHHWTGVDADAHEKLGALPAANLLGELHDGVADRQRGRDRAVGRVLVGDRCAEQSHEAVAGDLVDDALDPVDFTEGEPQVLVQQIMVLLGVEPLGDRGRPNEVAEEDRDELPLPGDAAARIADLAREVGGNVSRQAVIDGRRRLWRGGRSAPIEHVPAIGAEAKLRADLRTALRAAARHGGTAGVTELLALDQLALTARAAHGRTFGRRAE